MKEETVYLPTPFICVHHIPCFTESNLMTWSGNILKHPVYQYKCFLPLNLFSLNTMESAVEVLQGGSILGSERAKNNLFSTDNWACQHL